MANEIGTQTGVRGTSMAMNNQKGVGNVKPSPMAGNASPGGTKPPEGDKKCVEMAVPMRGKREY